MIYMRMDQFCVCLNVLQQLGRDGAGERCLREALA